MVLKGNIVENTIYVFVGLVVVFTLFAQLLPTAQAAGNDLNSSGAPLGSFFAANGIVWIILMAGLVILVVKAGMNFYKNK